MSVSSKTYNYSPAYPIDVASGSSETHLSAFQKIKLEIERIYRTINSEFSYYQNLINTLDSTLSSRITSGINGAKMPIGTIVAFGGSTSNIPSGWYICDGNNGTPDLRNRFIVGAGSTYSVGATGGKDSVTLTASNIPDHRHYVVSNAYGNTTFILNAPNNAIACYNNDGYYDCYNLRAADTSGDASCGLSSSPVDSNGTAMSSASTVDIRPKYYAVYYIMRIS